MLSKSIQPGQVLKVLYANMKRYAFFVKICFISTLLKFAISVCFISTVLKFAISVCLAVLKKFGSYFYNNVRKEKQKFFCGYSLTKRKK